ncbi:MAG: hypothetical protein AABW67_05450, partial [Nanoarchaeota archaeon]
MQTKNIKKINKENLITDKALISYLQILILVISSFAFSYLIYETSNPSGTSENINANNNLQNTNNQKTSLVNILGTWILEKIKQPILPMVSAADTGNVCCAETTTGKYCEEVISSECKPGAQQAPSACEETSFCKKGCCQSPANGLCSAGTPKSKCNSTWYEDAFCNVKTCQYGCCVIGNNAIFTNEKNCNFESSAFGVTPDFKSEIKTENECLFLTEKDNEGACVYGDNSCKYITAGECKTKKGSFYKNTFCSNSNLSTSCTPHAYDGCLVGKEGVYWFDSCGNREEVKQACSVLTGSVCGVYRTGKDTKPVLGDYVCRDINCVDSNEQKRQNGESWCEYDGAVGDGKDIVGSRHIKHLCINGEERIEPCADYRNQVCVESTTKTNGTDFLEASCRVNNWRQCIDYNSEEKPEKACKENPDCFYKKISVANKFTFDVCLPKSPEGFDLKNNNDDAKDICSMATQKCTVLYEKKMVGAKPTWVCISNCACEKAGAANKMNEWCTSLGDCGMKVNIAGEVTKDGFSATGTPAASNGHPEYANANADNNPLTSRLNENTNATGLGIGNSTGVSSDAFMNSANSGKEGGIFGKAGGLMGGSGSQQKKTLMMATAAVGGAIAVGYMTASTTPTAFSSAFSWMANPIFMIFFFILIFILILVIVMGLGKIKKKYVNFKCEPWQAPTGGANCDFCNGN